MNPINQQIWKIIYQKIIMWSIMMVPSFFFHLSWPMKVHVFFLFFFFLFFFFSLFLCFFDSPCLSWFLGRTKIDINVNHPVTMMDGTDGQLQQSNFTENHFGGKIIMISSLYGNLTPFQNSNSFISSLPSKTKNSKKIAWPSKVE